MTLQAGLHALKSKAASAASLLWLMHAPYIKDNSALEQSAKGLKMMSPAGGRIDVDIIWQHDHDQ